VSIQSLWLDHLVFRPSCHEKLFLVLHFTDQKTLLDTPVITSHSKAVLGAHAERFDFWALTWIKLSG